MRIHELRESGPLIAAMYRQVLQPSFPSSELVDLDEIQDIAACDTGSVWIAEDPGGIILGVAVAEWDADLRVLLLSYLAVRPGVRNGGVGGRLYAIALESWRNKFAPCVMITEIEDPAVHPAGVDHGDPVARQRFYLAHGGRILDLPYFQPACGQTPLGFRVFFCSFSMPTRSSWVPTTSPSMLNRSENIWSDTRCSTKDTWQWTISRWQCGTLSTALPVSASAFSQRLPAEIHCCTSCSLMASADDRNGTPLP